MAVVKFPQKFFIEFTSIWFSMFSGFFVKTVIIENEPRPQLVLDPFTFLFSAHIAKLQKKV